MKKQILTTTLFLITILLTVPLFAACPPNYNLTCGELITNGGFIDFTVDASELPLVNDFGSNLVCDWNSDGITTPDIQKSGNNYFARLASSLLPPSIKRSEGILKSIQLDSSKTYVLSFKLKKDNSRPSFPSMFNVFIFNAINFLPNAEILNVTPSEQILSIPSSQFNTTGDWETFTYCFSPLRNTDRMYFYGDNTSITSSRSILLDDISLKEFDANIGIDPTLEACVESRLIGTNCVIQGATYSWTPTTGLSNPNSAQTEVLTYDRLDRTYTLTMTIPNSTCTSSTNVLVRGHGRYQIDDNADVNFIKGYGIHTGGTQGLPVFISNTSFYSVGDFIVDEDISFINCDFLFASGAKITVNNNAFLSISSSNGSNSLTTCNPDIFWDGIYMDHDKPFISPSLGAILYLHGGQGNERYLELSNATNGVVLKNRANCTITNVIFDRNKKSINISGVGLTPGTTRIRGCEFKSSTPLKSENGSFYYPTYSIEVNNVAVFNFGPQKPVEIGFNPPGGGTPLDNEFDATGGGVFVNNASVKVKAKFNNFQNLLFAQGVPITSINPIKIYGASGSTTTQVFITSEFTDCKQAIYSNGFVELDLLDNTFNANANLMPTANFATVLNNLEQVNINDNIINNAGLGISVFNSSPLQINRNTLDLQTQSTSFYANKSNDRSVGISVMNLNLNDPNNPIPQNVIIAENEIKHSKTGISAEFTQANITNNEIYDLNDRYVQASNCYPLPSPCPPSPAYGIRTVGANYGYNINENTIKLDLLNYSTNPQNNPTVTAISIESSVEASNVATKVNCNQLEGTGIGLKFSGANSPATVVEENTMKNHFYGFVLANSGFIGDVGSNGIAADNEWNGSYGFSKTFADGSDGSRCTLFVQNIPKFNPSILPSHATSGYIEIQNNNAGNSASQATCETPSLRLKAGADSLFVRRPSVKDTTGFVRKLAKGKMNYMVHAADSAARLNQQLLYWQITHDSVLNADTSWQSFKDSMNNTALGKSLGNNSRAVSNPSTNNFDVNVNTIAAIESKLDSGLVINSKDTSNVARIATLCPYYDGIAVYQARYILMQMGYPPVVNACEITAKPARASKRIKSLNEEEITVYPNPTQGNLTVNLNIQEGQIVLFELYDVLGKKQDEIKLTEGNLHQLNLKQLQHGIYFYRLVARNSSILKSGKLIIQ